MGTALEEKSHLLHHLDMLVLKVLLICLTVTLNSLVVFVFSRLIRKKTFTNSLFLSISISDLGIGLIAMSSQVISDLKIRWPFGTHLCIISLFSQLVLPDITVQALLLLTIQRFMQLKFPSLTTERQTTWNILKLISLWMLPTAFWLMYLSIFARCGLLDTSERCHLDYPSLGFVLVKESIFSVLPLLLIICLNASSITFLYQKKCHLMNQARTYRFMSTPNLKSIKNIRQNYSPNGGANRRMRSKSVTNRNKRPTSYTDDKVLQNMQRQNYAKINKNLKALSCLLALTVSFAITQIPYIILWPISIYHSSSVLVTKVYNLAVWISYLTSIINSVLIFVFNDTVKRELKKFLRRHCKKTPTATTVN